MTDTNTLRAFFESEYPGKSVIFENLIKPIFDKAKDATLTDTQLPLDSEKKQIKSFSIIAQVRGAFPITFADVELQDSVALKRSRVQIQNCVRRLMNDNTNAIIFFHFADSKKEWRVSYVHRGETLSESTSAKRYTYLCGIAQHCRTVAERFAKLSEYARIDDEKLLEAFSVEALTKEFFNQLFKWYEQACAIAQFPDKDSRGKNVNLTKENNNLQLIRLITRLMFVWFIKHKDLVPAWIFDKTELNKILAAPALDSMQDGNYYNAVLQNLFFGALNKKITERAFATNSDHDGADNHYGIKTYYRDNNKDSFFVVSHDEMIERFCGVPFLNGGLFECLDWDETTSDGKSHTVHYIDGFSREPNRRAFVPNSLFWSEDEKQLGLIPLLSRYNFTVEESSPNDVQVALDPELLGKVFENLLGTYNPETQETARKDSGSFYTPREIVSFMVERSLFDYLQKKVPHISEIELKKLFDENALLNFENIALSPEQINALRNALFEIKIIDPACGSGAFPMGILNQLAELHTILDRISAQKDDQNTLPIKKGQCINYAPSGSDLNIKAEYIGDQMFTLKLNGKLEKLLYTSQDLALYVKEVINEYNKSHNKKTIANLFSQGRIDDGLSFNSIKSKQEIRQIVDADTKEIIWQYKTYNVENKFRSYRNMETDAVALEMLLNNDYEYAKYLYSLKKQIIQDSIYGVDIQPIAVQICKLRFFISLICEQPKNDDAEDNYGYNPLPNLETKFVAADTLTEKKKKSDDGYLFSNPRVEEIQKELDTVRKRHFAAKDAEEKKIIRNQDETLRKELAKILSEDKIYPPEDAKQLAEWNPYDQNATSSFFDADWMYGVKDGFDIVIGNPPYVQLQKDDGRLAKLYDGKDYATYAKMGDIYCLFYEKGYSLLNKTGRLCFITSNKWMRAGYGEKLRDYFAKNVNPKLLVDFAGVKVFESATVDTNILLFEKGKNEGNTKSCTATALTKDGLANLSDFVRQESYPCAFTNSDSWVILSPIEQSIKHKIEAVGVPLKDWDISINYGIKTGYNDAFVVSGAKRDEILANCKSDDERKRTAELIRPILRGRDIKRYSYNWANLWLIYIPWHFPLQFDQTIQGASEKAEKEFKKQYPAVYAYLLQYKKELSARNKAETGIRYEWYAMQRWGANYWDEFNKPKIVWARLMRLSKSDLDAFPRFCAVPEGFFIVDSLCFFTGADIDILLQALNSEFAAYYFFNSVATLDNGGFQMRQ